MESEFFSIASLDELVLLLNCWRPNLFSKSHAGNLLQLIAMINKVGAYIPSSPYVF